MPAANLIEGTNGNGDLLINRNFAWSGPVAGIGAVAVARAAYEDALDWAKTYTAGGPKPIINYQYPGYVLGDVAAKIEAARYFCWKIGALPRPARLPRRDARRDVQDPLHRDAVRLRLQVHAGRRGQLGRQEAQVRPVPARGGDPAALRRRATSACSVAASTASWSTTPFNPRAFMDDEPVEFTKAMEGIDTIPGPKTDGQQTTSQADKSTFARQ